MSQVFLELARATEATVRENTWALIISDKTCEHVQIIPMESEDTDNWWPDILTYTANKDPPETIVCDRRAYIFPQFDGLFVTDEEMLTTRGIWVDFEEFMDQYPKIWDL